MPCHAGQSSVVFCKSCSGGVTGDSFSLRTGTIMSRYAMHTLHYTVESESVPTYKDLNVLLSNNVRIGCDPVR